MQINRNKLLKYIRLVIYILMIIFILLLKYTNTIKFVCFINENYGILCPTCGITRAIAALSNFNFSLAVQRNAYFTLILCPIFIVLVVDDILCMIKGKRSFIEIILGE